MAASMQQLSFSLMNTNPMKLHISQPKNTEAQFHFYSVRTLCLLFRTFSKLYHIFFQSTFDFTRWAKHTMRIKEWQKRGATEDDTRSILKFEAVAMHACGIVTLATPGRSYVRNQVISLLQRIHICKKKYEPEIAIKTFHFIEYPLEKRFTSIYLPQYSMDREHKIQLIQVEFTFIIQY